MVLLGEGPLRMIQFYQYMAHTAPPAYRPVDTAAPGAGRAQGSTRTSPAPAAGISTERSPLSQRRWTVPHCHPVLAGNRSEEHTSELQSLMRISYAVFCLKKKQ